jgi:hypothetical protein
MAKSKKPSLRRTRGLVPKPPPRGQRRPGQPGVRRPPPATPPGESEKAFEPIDITTHRELAVQGPEIMKRLNSRPEIAVMMFINPVLAMQDVGVRLTPELRDHVLRATQHPPALRKRREALEAELTETLGEKARPNDPAWVSDLLFKKLALKPLRSLGHDPLYRSPPNAAIIERLRKKRRTIRHRYPGERLIQRKSVLRVRVWNPAVRRLDLDAEVPYLEPADEIPGEVTLETLWFYKDSHPTVRSVLELGIIERQSFPFHTPDTYRQILDGRRANAFRAWFRSVTFKERPR